MMKKIITTILLTISINSNAYQVDDLTKYTDKCLTRYNALIEKNGKTNLRGVYLKYDQKDKIKELYSTMYFQPDYSFNVLYSDFAEQTIYDLKENVNTYTYYSKKANKDGNRTGVLYVLKDVGNDEFVLRMYAKSRIEFDENNYEIPYFEDVVYFDEDNTIDKIKFKREKDKEKDLFEKYSVLKSSCLK